MDHINLLNMKTLKHSNGPHIHLFWCFPSISRLKASKEKCKKLNQAIDEVKPVEIVTTRDLILKLNKIGVESGRFYGFESLEGSMKKVLLNIHDIKTIILL